MNTALVRSLACLVALVSLAPGKAVADTDPLVELNRTFRKVYANTRKNLLDQSNPLILVESDKLVLLRDGKRMEAPITPETYQTLKMVAHIPLAIYVMLLPERDGAMPDPLLSELEGFNRQVGAAAKSLEQRGLAKASLERSRRVIAESQQFVEQLLATKQLKRGDRTAFAQRLGPILLAISADAARAEIDLLHRQVSAWKAEMPAAQWKQLRVVIMGGAMPRKGNLATQYFARLLREAGEGPRIIYAESLREEGRALSLLGTHLLDTAIGADFFLDPRRMHRDLLADAAEAYLATLKFDGDKP